jgi:hypothetical protein
VASSVVGPAARADAIDVTDCIWNADAQYDGLGDGFGGIDRNAFYALAYPPANVPGAHFRFVGQFPKARYFGLQTYGDSASPIDALPDAEMVADEGSVNPFRGEAWEPGHVSYTVDLLDVPPALRQHPRPPNVLYGGYQDFGQAAHRDQIEYRIYVPDRSVTGDGIVPGDVPLPRVLYVVDDPAMAPWTTHDEVCANTSSGLTFRAIHILDELFIELDKPIRDSRLPPSSGTDPPQWITSGKSNRFYPYVNQEAGYLLTFVNDFYGDVLALHFKAPSFVDDGDPITADRQVRYWSLCTIQTVNFFYTDACLRDHELHPDGDGFVTIAVSLPENRPANAVDWVPFPGGDSMLFMRQVAPNPATFAESNYFLAGGAGDAAIRHHMGEYYPAGAYCSKAAFEAGACS